ncbi:MAG: hypothetical protein COA71_01235 [SAR86 cluster bacterium]|uniref:Thioredoxin domain-containing protein n=1 Tax=SAR86 cluster bacterium TaxID=2030880 RepID=A0A2A5CJ39_9GAMM|nr:hypothetical protein [Gammaproteobacteria bacterium AH-315-E17]PCJ43525.1 MAG: hypothetical protein COA71_01235 [SAR86 cluster bacterium]
MDRANLKLTLLLATIALPIGLASFSFYQGEGGSATTNNGVLISPVVDITEFAMEDQNGIEAFQSFETMVEGVEVDDYVPRPWSLIFLGTGSCDEVCGDRLFYLRQLHRLLSGDADRVARYYVNVGTSKVFDANTQSMFNEAFTDMTKVYSQGDVLLNNLAAIIPEGVNPVAEHYIFVADPLGNVMMYFTPENTPDEILRDLEKLLDQSSLG